jgi:adenylate cyclase
LGPSVFADLLNRFYAEAHRVLVPRRAVIDKMIGDEVMAFFIPSFEPNYRGVAIETAVELQRALLTADDGKPLLPVGIGVHAGEAFVGKVGTDDVSDFTAIGDMVNTASRLQSVAGAGEVAISEELAAVAPPDFAHAEKRTMEVRGREQSLDVRVLKVSA